jgi:hypothetical protein
MADATPASKLYLFKGNQYLKIDPTTMQIEGEPGPIGDWSGLAAALNGGAAVDRIDAANYGPDGAVFFKGDKYCTFDPQKDSVSKSGQISDYFKNLPNDANGDFTKDLDAVLQDVHLTWMLFKGGHIASAPAATMDAGGRSLPIPSVWRVPYPYQMGVQAATAFTPVQQDWYLFRGDSWTTYETATSKTIETLVPGISQYGFDYDLDAALMGPFDKKQSVSAYPFTVPDGTALTVTVLNNLSAQATVNVAVGAETADPLQVSATQETHKTYTANSGQLNITVTDDQGKPLRLSANNEQVGGGSCLYIGAEKEAAGLYTDVVVLITWPSKVA